MNKYFMFILYKKNIGGNFANVFLCEIFSDSMKFLKKTPFLFFQKRSLKLIIFYEFFDIINL